MIIAPFGKQRKKIVQLTVILSLQQAEEKGYERMTINAAKP
jgi:hypothetical protein